LADAAAVRTREVARAVGIAKTLLRHAARAREIALLRFAAHVVGEATHHARLLRSAAARDRFADQQLTARFALAVVGTVARGRVARPAHGRLHTRRRARAAGRAIGLRRTARCGRAAEIRTLDRQLAIEQAATELDPAQARGAQIGFAAGRRAALA